MKLSKETLAILKNFARINSNLMVFPGNRIKTVNSQQPSIVAYATVEETFPTQFGIYDLPAFIGALDLFETTPDLKFENNYVRMEGTGSSVKFYYANESLLVYSKKKIVFQGADVEFTIKEQDFQRIMRASSTLASTDVGFVGDGSGSVAVVVGDKSSQTSNAFTLDLGAASSDIQFTAYLKIENMKMIPGEYKVSLNRHKVGNFLSLDEKLQYIIALEVQSTSFVIPE